MNEQRTLSLNFTYTEYFFENYSSSSDSSSSLTGCGSSSSSAGASSSKDGLFGISLSSNIITLPFFELTSTNCTLISVYSSRLLSSQQEN